MASCKPREEPDETRSLQQRSEVFRLSYFRRSCCLLHYTMHLQWAAVGPVDLAHVSRSVAAEGMEGLPIEIVQMVAYETRILTPTDVVSLALTSKTVYGMLLGVLGSENVFDRNQHRALAGPLHCAENEFWEAAVMAVNRGIGDPAEEGGISEMVRMWGDVFHTPFTLACRGDQTGLLSALLGRGICRLAEGLAVACENGSVACAELLLGETEEVDHRWIRVAAMTGKTEIVALLLDDGRADPGGHSNFALRMAARGGHLDTVRLLLQDPRVDPSDRESQGFRDAAQGGHTDVVRLLLDDQRVDPNASSGEAIRYASARGHVEIVQLLLSTYEVASNIIVAAKALALRNRHLQIVDLLTAVTAMSEASSS